MTNFKTNLKGVGGQGVMHNRTEDTGAWGLLCFWLKGRFLDKQDAENHPNIPNWGQRKRLTTSQLRDQNSGAKGVGRVGPDATTNDIGGGEVI